MTNWEFLFFLGFLLIQLVIPGRRLVYALLFRRCKLMEMTRFFMFSWTMRLRQVGGSGTIRAYDRSSGQTLLLLTPEEILTPRQCRFLYGNPRSVLELVKFMERRLKEKGMKNFGINAHLTAETSHRAPHLIVDPTVDLTKERFRLFSHYPWDLT